MVVMNVNFLALPVTLAVAGTGTDTPHRSSDGPEWGSTPPQLSEAQIIVIMITEARQRSAGAGAPGSWANVKLRQLYV